MYDRHRLAHAGLAAVHLAMALLLLADGQARHAACATVAALLYFALSTASRA
jgi:hypothetical protein